MYRAEQAQRNEIHGTVWTKFAAKKFTGKVAIHSTMGLL
jgi:hypothetical protein